MKSPLIVPALMSVALSACSVVGIRSGTAEPKYTVISTVGPVQIRHYDERIAAETTITGSVEHARYQGFRRLAGYIFGANRTRTKIAMTAPVAQSASQTIAMTAPVAQTQTAAGAWTIQFFMPAHFTMETLPVPNDPSVHLVTVPAETYAALRFSGLPNPSAVAREQSRLLALLKSSPWTPVGEPTAWFYDPPWTLPFLRRNEVAVKVVKSGD
ncbi:SOUL family heme-binding protein [Acidiphilium sp.]|uniref:SOUL family heme-binding protein n=1 Tax=Acidiphilium sp. TaxID=527 RepID=UPI003D0913B5